VSPSGLTLGLAIAGATLLGIALISLLVFVIIIYAFRRAVRPAEDPAVSELKRRLASGEISPAEYEVRLRALQRGD
jgi:uncharacterized membrane protein